MAEKMHDNLPENPLSELARGNEPRVRAENRLPIGRTERSPRFNVGPPGRIEILRWGDRISNRGGSLNLFVGVCYAIGHYPSPRESGGTLVDNGGDQRSS